MDLLVLIWTGCMEDVEHIVSRRVNSLSPFGPAVMEEQGILHLTLTTADRWYYLTLPRLQ